MIKTVYIAGSSKLTKKCTELANHLETTFDLKITRRWWEYYLQDFPDFIQYSDKEFYAHPQVQMIRELDLKAVRDADLVIIIVNKDVKLTGALVECGYAMALNKIIIFLGPVKRSSMLSGCIHITTEEQLFELITRDC